jgi:hypothetical protein
MEAVWFEAPCPDGALRLRVAVPQPVRHAARAALALQDAAPLLDALDDWSLLDADWRWIETPATTGPPPQGHARADWRPAGDGPPAAQIDVPWALLRRLPPPPETIALDWARAEGVVVLSRLRLTTDDLTALEPGGVLLLPESMGADWSGVLRPADEPAGGTPLGFSTPWAPTTLERGSALPPPAALAHDGVACEVRLADVGPVGADRLAGWTPGPLGATEDSGPLGAGAVLWQCADAQGPARCLARGPLVRWGDGWALALDTTAPTEDPEGGAEL